MGDMFDIFVDVDREIYGVVCFELIIYIEVDWFFELECL